MIVPKLEYAGEMWKGNSKFVKQLETVQMTAAEKVLAYPSTTSNSALGAELGTYPLKTNEDVRKLKWQYKLRPFRMRDFFLRLQRDFVLLSS